MTNGRGNSPKRETETTILRLLRLAEMQLVDESDVELSDGYIRLASAYEELL